MFSLKEHEDRVHEALSICKITTFVFAFSLGIAIGGIATIEMMNSHTPQVHQCHEK